MTQKNKTVCPMCAGKKVIAGKCSCSMEWRGTQSGDDWEDCQCTPEVECPTCHGNGYIETDK